jgi:hypothetical protein
LTSRVVVIIAGALAIASLIVWLGLYCSSGSGSNPYLEDREMIKVAIASYIALSWDLNPPTTGEEVTIDRGTFRVIDICPLVDTGPMSPGVLEGVPASCADTENDNCDTGVCSCNPNGHYTWLVDTGSLEVYSTCVGEGCKARDVDGYQDVYP